MPLVQTFVWHFYQCKQSTGLVRTIRECVSAYGFQLKLRMIVCVHFAIIASAAELRFVNLRMNAFAHIQCSAVFAPSPSLLKSPCMHTHCVCGASKRANYSYFHFFLRHTFRETSKNRERERERERIRTDMMWCARIKVIVYCLAGWRAVYGSSSVWRKTSTRFYSTKIVFSTLFSPFGCVSVCWPYRHQRTTICSFFFFPVARFVACYCSRAFFIFRLRLSTVTSFAGGVCACVLFIFARVYMRNRNEHTILWRFCFFFFSAPASSEFILSFVWNQSVLSVGWSEKEIKCAFHAMTTMNECSFASHASCVSSSSCND